MTNKTIAWVNLSPGVLEHLDSGFQIKYEMSKDGYMMWVLYNPLTSNKVAYHHYLDEVKKVAEKMIHELDSSFPGEDVFLEATSLIKKIMGMSKKDDGLTT